MNMVSLLLMFADFEPNRMAMKEAVRQEFRLQLEQDQSGDLRRELSGCLRAFGYFLQVSPFDRDTLEALTEKGLNVDYLAGEALFHTKRIRWGWGEVLGIKQSTVRKYRSDGLQSIREELQAESRRREARLNFYAWQSAL